METDPPSSDEPERVSTDDEKVGYCRPPRHSRFPKGKSGNPRGRRKGSRGIKTDLQAELAASHTIHINGRPEKGTRQQLMMRTLVTRAATGDVKAAALLIPLALQVLGIEDRGSDRDRLSPQDEKLLDELLHGYAGDPGMQPAAGAPDGGTSEDGGTNR